MKLEWTFSAVRGDRSIGASVGERDIAEIMARCESEMIRAQRGAVTHRKRRELGQRRLMAMLGEARRVIDDDSYRTHPSAQQLVIDVVVFCAMRYIKAAKLMGTPLPWSLDTVNHIQMVLHDEIGDDDPVITILTQGVSAVEVTLPSLPRINVWALEPQLA